MREALSVCLALVLVLGLVPALDIAATALFFDGSGFPVSGAPVAELLREAVWAAALGAFAGSALLCAVSAIRPVLLPARELGWSALTFLLGPGLLVNGILKQVWGRARPRDVEAFGGEATFTPWWRPAAECASNCSFVSGEASGGAALALVLWIWLSPRVPRLPLLAGLAAILAISGGLRIAKGAHFTSDVLMAWVLTAALGLALRRMLRLPVLARS